MNGDPIEMSLPLRGHLVYIMGASGSGKDSLLNWIRTTAASSSVPVKIARRTITRAESVDESSIAVTTEAFAARQAAGAFALHWRSHGFDYGIDVEIDRWMAAGAIVIVNGSRGYLAQAWQRYAMLTAVEIVVAPDILRKRLLSRGRESAEAIEERLQRAISSFPAPADCTVVDIHNDGDLGTAGQALWALILKLARFSSGG